jgi:TRAP-type transport system large permease protein
MLWVFFGVLFLAVFGGVPVSFALGLAAIAMMIIADVPPSLLVQQAIRGVNDFPLLAIPLFILVGQLMTTGGIARRLIDLASALVGWITGGLGQVNVAASMMFGGLSGSAVADTSAVGGIMIPQMRRQGYTAGHATSITISSALIGILLPPSIPLILFGVVTETSISRLFLAGVVPAVLLLVILMIVTYITAKRSHAGRRQPFDLRHLATATRKAWLGLMLPLIILFGIRGGYFTATEAGMVSALYALVVSMVIYRELKPRDLPGVFVATARTTGMVMFLVAMAMSVAWLLTTQLVARDLVDGVAAISTNPLVVLPLLLGMLLLVGIVMDLSPAILILAPMTLPIAEAVGINPVYYGVMMVLVLGIGLLTPPVGTVLFVGCAVGRVRVEEAIRPMLPYYLALLLAVAILLAFPQLVFLLL